MPFKKTSNTNDFREVQHFNQWWVWAVVMGLAGAGWWAFVEQILMGRAWGNNPAPDAVVVVMWLGFGIGLPLMMRGVRLIVRVSDGALHLRYVPFRYRVIPLTTITSAEPTRYRPMREYFGWGIRWMPGRGWVYSVSGDQGVRLVLGKRRKLLIGSRKPFELAAAIVSNQTPDFDGPSDRESEGERDRERGGEHGTFGEHSNVSEDEPMFETPNESRLHVAGTHKAARARWLSKIGARTRACVRGVRAAFFPAIGRAVGWIQNMARRVGASERVQRFADNPGAHAAAAGQNAVEAGKHAGGKVARAGERAKKDVSQRLRDVHVPSRVAEPAMRYMRNPQLIVDDFRKTG